MHSPPHNKAVVEQKMTTSAVSRDEVLLSGKHGTTGGMTAETGIRKKPRVLSPLEVANWDAMVRCMPRATVFHGTGWARTILDSYGHQAAYLLWGDESEPTAICPIIQSRSILGKLRGVTTAFADACEPLRTASGPDLKTILEAVLSLGRTRRWQWYQLSAAADSLGMTPSISYHSHQLSLTQSEQELFDGLTCPARRGVRKAKDAGVTVEFLEDESGARQYHRLHCLTRRRHGLPPQPVSFFDSLGRNLLDGKSGFVTLARVNGEPAAAAVFLAFGNHAVYKYSASDDGLRHCYPGNLVMWESIRRLRSMGCQTLDFGRTSLVNEGLRRFKLAWGTEEGRINSYRFLLPEGRTIRVNDASYGWHTRILRRLPGFALRWIGKLLYPFQS